MKYIHILVFLITRDISELKEYWRSDFLRKKKFKWRKLISKVVLNSQQSNFYFWWRLANEMYIKGNKKHQKAAAQLQKSLVSTYSVDVMLGAKIGKGFFIPHFTGLVIPFFAEIGENFTCCQGVTIGINKESYSLKIGNNVFVGANSAILCGNIEIGNNVKIGAMTLITQNIPSNTIVYTERVNKTIVLDNSS